MTPERDQQIMDVFLAAVELPKDRRTAYLVEACGPDEALRAEVESLIEHHVPDTLFSRDGSDTPAHPNSRSRIRPALGPRQVLKNLRRWRLTVASVALAACFAVLWHFAHRTIEQNLRQNVRSQLQTVLDADLTAVEMWRQKWIHSVETWSAQPRVRELCTELMRLEDAQDLTTSQLEASATHTQFLDALGPVLAQPETRGVAFFTRDGHVIATNPVPHPGDVYTSAAGAANIARVFQGETIYLKPYMEGSNIVGELRSDKIPLTAVIAPVRDSNGDVIAALMFRMRIDHQFAKLFSAAQLGETGETYAFDERGVVLTDLRREERLRRKGLIPKGGVAALNLQLRDPGVDLTANASAKYELTTRPITKVPALAIAGNDAVDVEGYRNYFGVNVVGTSRWLADCGFGVVTEMAYDEAYSPLQSLTWIFRGVFGLFVCAATIAAFCWLKTRWLREQVAEARKLGQYTLGELIGQGGMGKVYKATHAMLRRPTAIKLIEPRDADTETIARFEREVQLASDLTHPNTVQIYDYGCTEDGVFYFAMEYLPGTTLDELVVRDGPLPAARAVHVLRQVCASLCEAHRKGLVHRDVKPANIMLCERGGQYDFVKVLDFGLVKRTSTVHDAQATGSQDLSGTPLYIAPERIRQPSTLDPRSDVYSLGTVAFYLLTGGHLFDGESTMDILYKVMNELPRRPSEVASQGVPGKLDELVLDCLAKDPDERLADIGIVLESLDSIAVDLPWRQTDARQWWRVHQPLVVQAMAERADACQGEITQTVRTD